MTNRLLAIVASYSFASSEMNANIFAASGQDFF